MAFVGLNFRLVVPSNGSVRYDIIAEVRRGYGQSYLTLYLTKVSLVHATVHPRMDMLREQRGTVVVVASIDRDDAGSRL